MAAYLSLKGFGDLTKLSPSARAFTPLIYPVWSPKVLVGPLSLWSTQALSLFSQFHNVVIQVKSQSVDSDLCLACLSVLAVESGTPPIAENMCTSSTWHPWWHRHLQLTHVQTCACTGI